MLRVGINVRCNILYFLFSINLGWLGVSRIKYKAINYGTVVWALLNLETIQPGNSAPRAVLWLVQVSVLLIHLSKITHHNEEKRPLPNNVKNSDLDPRFFYLVVVLHRNWKTSHSIMKSCEEGNYPSQKPHRKKKEEEEEDNRELGKTTEPFVCPIVSDTNFSS